MLKLYVCVLEYYVTIKKNEVELYILEGLQDFLCYKKASCRTCIVLIKPTKMMGINTYKKTWKYSHLAVNYGTSWERE